MTQATWLKKIDSDLIEPPPPTPKTFFIFYIRDIRSTCMYFNYFDEQ